MLPVTVLGVIYMSAAVVAQDWSTDLITPGQPTTVFEPPQPNLQLQSAFSEPYATEKVVLKCIIDGSSDWNIKWNRDHSEIRGSDFSLSEESSKLTITAGTSAVYTCQGQHKIKGILTKDSNRLVIKVQDPPTPNLKLVTNWTHVFESERVEMTCEAGVSGWTFSWYKDDVKMNQEMPKLSIPSVTQSNKGKYSCQLHLKSRGISSGLSNSVDINISELPKPTLKQLSSWSDVFEKESVSFNCQFHISGWTFSWHKNGKKLQDNTALLSISEVTRNDQGSYTCRVQLQSRNLNSKESNSILLNVYTEKAKPHATKSTAFEKMYPGESIEFSCQVRIATGWNYMWYLNGSEIPAANSPTYKIDNIDHSNSGLYFCKAKRGHFFSEESDKLSLQVSDPPTPNLKLVTNWTHVFESEKVEMTCEAGVSGWTFSWYKDGAEINDERPKLSIPSVTQSNKGKYECQLHLKSRGISSGLSNSVDINIYAEKAKPHVTKSTAFEKMYPGESIEFNCQVRIATGWNYVWYLNGNKIPAVNSPTYKIINIDHSNHGQYFCEANRDLFFSEKSDKLSLQVSDPPKPSLKLLTSWLDVFEKEKVEMSCNVNNSTWTFTWYKDDIELIRSSSLTWDEKGSKLTISSVAQNHGGSYACKAHLPLRGVSSELSTKLTVTVYKSFPKPELKRNPFFDLMYVGESVSFTCKVSVSSGWKYTWYKDSNVLPNSGESITINLGLQDRGKYWCNATRDNILFFQSNAIDQNVMEIPEPLLKPKNKQLDVFPGEMVDLSCMMQLDSGWTYTWFKGGKLIQADNRVVMGKNGATISFHIDPSHHQTQTYTCKAELKGRSVHSSCSPNVTLTVYDALPTVRLLQSPEHSLMHTGDSVSFRCNVIISSGWKYLWFKNGVEFKNDDQHNISSAGVKDTGTYTCHAVRDSIKPLKSQSIQIEVKVRPQAEVILLTGWAQVFSTDSLELMCKVTESEDRWNYTWFKEKNSVGEVPAETYTVTPQDDPDQSYYTCKGIRTERPTYSTESSPFKTKNLLLKRRILLSVSGCLFFGIILAFLGCIYFKIRKRDVPEEKPEENELFLTMKKQLEHTENPCPLVAYITDAALNEAPKENDDVDLIHSDSTDLAIATQEDQAVIVSTATENGGAMISFQKVS